MASAIPKGLTLGQGLAWINTFLDYTDKVCDSVPEAELDARFTDPGGGFFFSARELMMHMADKRWDVVSWIDGGDTGARLFQTVFGGHERPWEFRQAGKDEIMQSLRDGRAALTAILARPAGEMLEPTDSLRQSYDKRLAAAREQGQDTAELEAAGPSCLANTLLFLAAHEQSHRGELQWLLRTRGADVFRYI